MPSFWVELGASKLTVTAAKSYLKKNLLNKLDNLAKEGIEDKIKKEAVERGIEKKTKKEIAKDFTEGLIIASVGAISSGDAAVRTIQNKMPGYIVNDGEIIKIYDGMDNLSASSQGVVGSVIEFGTEMTGKYATKFFNSKGGKLWKAVATTKGGDKFIKNY